LRREPGHLALGTWTTREWAVSAEIWEGVTFMTPEARSSVQRAIAAANAGDTETFLACFEATGSVDDWGRVFVGPDEIRRWSDKEFIGVNVSLDVREFVTKEDSAVVAAEVGGSGFRGTSHFTFFAPGTLVRSMEIRA
jgi:hypothetical protein